MNDSVQVRLDELKAEYELGQVRLQELGRQEARLRETLLRISGAVQVLEELLSGAAASEHTPDPAGSRNDVVTIGR